MNISKLCISCSKSLLNDRGGTSFKCPKCGEFEINRCGHCRKIASKYTCVRCGFSGPN